MNRQYAQIAASNERWQRHNFSRLMAVSVGVLAVVWMVLNTVRS